MCAVLGTIVQELVAGFTGVMLMENVYDCESTVAIGNMFVVISNFCWCGSNGRRRNLNWTIYAIECVVAVVLFTGVIMIPLCKNPIWWIHDYPKDIQENILKHMKDMDKAYHRKKYHVVHLCIGMVLGLLSCLLCGLLAMLIW